MKKGKKKKRKEKKEKLALFLCEDNGRSVCFYNKTCMLIGLKIQVYGWSLYNLNLPIRATLVSVNQSVNYDSQFVNHCSQGNKNEYSTKCLFIMYTL